MPTTPQYAAGSLVDPPVSDAKALQFPHTISRRRIFAYDKKAYTRHIPAATATALPPELPPATLASSEGLSKAFAGSPCGLDGLLAIPK